MSAPVSPTEVKGAHGTETAPDFLNPEFNMRAWVAEELTSRMLKRLGISLPPERQHRIAVEMDYWVQKGAGGAWGFTVALDMELRMYGTPTEEQS